MKKLLALFLLCLGASAFATPTYYSQTGPTSKAVVSLPSGGFSFLALDVQLSPGDTAYSRPFDVINSPIVYRDTGVGDGTIVYDYTLGTTLLTCYDARDSSGVVDSVNASYVTQISRFAGDNSNPNATGDGGNKSDTWTLPSATTANGASDANAFVDAAIQGVFVTLQSQRFVRFKVYNSKSTAQNVSRCRVYWNRRPMQR